MTERKYWPPLPETNQPRNIGRWVKRTIFPTEFGLTAIYNFSPFTIMIHGKEEIFCVARVMTEEQHEGVADRATSFFLLHLNTQTWEMNKVKEIEFTDLQTDQDYPYAYEDARVTAISNENGIARLKVVVNTQDPHKKPLTASFDITHNANIASGPEDPNAFEIGKIKVTNIRSKNGVYILRNPNPDDKSNIMLVRLESYNKNILIFTEDEEGNFVETDHTLYFEDHPQEDPEKGYVSMGNYEQIRINNTYTIGLMNRIIQKGNSYEYYIYQTICDVDEDGLPRVIALVPKPFLTYEQGLEAAGIDIATHENERPHKDKKVINTFGHIKTTINDIKTVIVFYSYDDGGTAILAIPEEEFTAPAIEILTEMQLIH